MCPFRKKNYTPPKVIKKKPDFGREKQLLNRRNSAGGIPQISGSLGARCTMVQCSVSQNIKTMF